MFKFCSDCKYLITSKSKCDGIYMCKKIKKYTNASTQACPKFEKTYARNQYESQQLINKGKEVYRKPSDRPVKSYVFILVVLIIALIIFKLLGY